MDYSEFIKAEWKIAYEDSFTFLKTLPSSKVRERISLFEKNKDLFTLDFIQKFVLRHPSITEDQVFNILKMQSKEKGEIAFIPTNDLKHRLKHYLSKCEDENERIEWENILKKFENLKTPNAKETRKAFFPILEKAFNSKFRNNGGGWWSLVTSFNTEQYIINLDFGGRFSAMRYWVEPFPKNESERTNFIAYEDIMGFGDPDWNLMRSDLMEWHAKVFIDTVHKTIKAMSSKK